MMNIVPPWEYRFDSKAFSSLGAEGISGIERIEAQGAGGASCPLPLKLCQPTADRAAPVPAEALIPHPLRDGVGFGPDDRDTSVAIGPALGDVDVAE
jgi:hypothetical protein